MVVNDSPCLLPFFLLPTFYFPLAWAMGINCIDHWRFRPFAPSLPWLAGHHNKSCSKTVFAESLITNVSQSCPNNRPFSFVQSMQKISLELVMLACVCSCLCDPVQNWKWSESNIQAFLVCVFFAYLAIIWNNWKGKYLKHPQNVWHWLLAKVHLDSNEVWPDWEKNQTPM